MKPDEFERQIARILTTLSANKEQVIWNDKFPDPDNPTQLRQVDISIRRADSLTIVECRLHNRPQDVKWVEELYGRRVSLNATAVIGISSSGFTKGALEKARRLGVFLRTWTELSDREIEAWGQRSKFELSFIQFEKVYLRIIADDSVVFPNGLSGGLSASDGGNFDFRAVLSHCANMLVEQSLPEGPFSLHLRLKNVMLGRVPVNEIVLSASWRWISKQADLPSVLVFNDIVDVANRPTLVERGFDSRSEVHHTPDRSLLIIDVNSAPPGGCCLLRRITGLFEKTVTMNEIILIGIGEPNSDGCPYTLSIERRSSAAYQQFLLRTKL